MIGTPHADTAASADAVDLSFKPYVLWRRGMLPFSALASLVPERTWTLLEELETGRLARIDLAGRIGDRLYALIPASAAGARPDLLRLRRDLHNDRRPPAAVMDAVERLLDGDDLAALREWRQSRTAADERRAAASNLLAAESREARRRIARMASDAYFLRGIQLSGPHLYESVHEYRAEAGREGPLHPTKRLRQTESTILRYACRMSLRTAPFGAFTEVGATAWQAPPAAEDGGERRHVVNLNRSALVWMAGALRRIEGGDRVLQLRLNNTARLASGAIDAFARGVRGSVDSFLGERVVRVRAVAPVQAVVDLLASGPHAMADVVRHLVERGMAADQAAALVERLVEAGLCHQDLALPDQTRCFAGAVAARLRTVATPAAAACAEIFEGLQRIEDGFGSASVEERERLLESIGHHVKRFAGVSGALLPAVERTLLFEDVSARGPARTWYPDLLERSRGHFLRVQQLLPAFDDATFARLGLYRWFVSRFGEQGRCDDLLAAYRAFAEQPTAEIDAVMLGLHEPLADGIRAHQRRILARLAEGVAAAGEATAFTLDEPSVEDLAATSPAALAPWTEASYRLQLVPASEDGPPLLVVNSVAAGHGVFFSRFCDVVEPVDPKAWSLRRSLRDTIAREAPRQADLTAVLGLNINLHPSLTPLEVVYPGSIASRGDALTLRDLALEADAEGLRLRLVSRRDGQPVDLAPMNFLLPVAAPMLYRFLCALAPLVDYRLGVWDSLRRWSGREYTYLPRLAVGGLVLERRRWYVPAAEIRALGDPAGAERLDTLLSLRAWHEARGIPRECFFRTQRVVERVAPRSWTEETQRTLDVRSARRKGQYLDFRNPFLLRLLLDRAHAAGADRMMMFEECLPPTTTYRGHAPAAAEELLVETRYSVRSTSAALLAVARHAGTRQAAAADAPSTETATA